MIKAHQFATASCIQYCFTQSNPTREEQRVCAHPVASAPLPLRLVPVQTLALDPLGTAPQAPAEAPQTLAEPGGQNLGVPALPRGILLGQEQGRGQGPETSAAGNPRNLPGTTGLVAGVVGGKPRGGIQRCHGRFVRGGN